MTDNRLISLKHVLTLVPLSKSEIYRRIKAGTFPRQVRLGASRIAFVEAEIADWLRVVAERKGARHDHV